MGEQMVPKSEYDNLRARFFASHLKVPLTIRDNGAWYWSNNTSRCYKYSKDDVSRYLKQPILYAKELRDVSIYMYANSMHYYNLINFYALMPTWDYTVTPLKFDKRVPRKDEVYRQYLRVTDRLQNMNIKHEFIKIMRTCFREDVFYGLCYEDKEQFYIQKLNPDWCQISSVEDGVFNFAVNLGCILEPQLALYPDYIRKAWKRWYKKGDQYRWFEIPAEYSICIKCNEDLPYPVPPFAAAMELIYDIDDYGDLIKERAKIEIYKLLHLTIPTDSNMEPMDWDLSAKYYEQMAQVIPNNVGLVMSPMKLEEIKFEKSGLADTDEVAHAEQRFWNASGTSPLLFGGNANGSVTALKLSIQGNEQQVLALMRQIERWMNRRIRRMAGKIKFKVNILPVTHFNVESKTAAYKEAATYGLPVKSMYAAVQNMEPNDVSAMNYLENEVLEYDDLFVPLASSYTQSSSDNEAGRPTNESRGKDLTPSGEQTQRDEENIKRER